MTTVCHLVLFRDCSEFLVRGEVALFGKSANKKHIPPPLGVTIKFWYPPPPLGVTVENGYIPPRVPEPIQGSRGIQGGSGIARKGYFASFCFYFCVCKRWIPPL